MTTSGNSRTTAKLIPSLLSAMPGPLLAVAARLPAKAAPITDPMAAISSSAWNVRTSKFFSAAKPSRMVLAGVMGYEP